MTDGVSGPASASQTRPGQYLPVLLIWSCLLLLPFGRLVEIPVLLMSVAGLVVLARHRADILAWPQLRVFALVFALFWLPIVISLVDAINPQRTALVAVNHLRFFFSGVFMVWVLSRAHERERLLTLGGWLLAFWLFDAVVQMLLGFDLIGREKVGELVSGLYGSTSRKLGTTLGVIVPLLWVFVQRRYSPWVLLLALLVSAFVLMAAGARAGWVSFLVCACLFAWANRACIGRLSTQVLLIAIVSMALLPVLAYFISPAFHSRFDESVGELTGAVEVEQSPLGHRGYIWKGAAAMIADNPVNGVGARGFRDAFAEYAAADDPFVAQVPPQFPTHSHQLLLEITAETGLIGLAGLVLALAILARAAWRAPARVRAQITPYGIAICAAFFPLNTHLAIYSAHWSQIVWWLIGVYCACLCAPRRGTGKLTDTTINRPALAASAR